VHSLACDRVQVHRQGGHQRLALARAHFGDLSVVQGHAAQQLHIEVTHLECALAALAHHSEGFRQQLVERIALGKPLAEPIGFGPQSRVVERFELRFQGVDLSDDLPVLPQQSVIAATENRGEKLGQHAASGVGDEISSAAEPVSIQNRSTQRYGAGFCWKCGMRWTNLRSAKTTKRSVTVKASNITIEPTVAAMKSGPICSNWLRIATLHR